MNATTDSILDAIRNDTDPDSYIVSTFSDTSAYTDPAYDPEPPYTAPVNAHPDTYEPEDSIMAAMPYINRNPIPAYNDPAYPTHPLYNLDDPELHDAEQHIDFMAGQTEFFTEPAILARFANTAMGWLNKAIHNEMEMGFFDPDDLNTQIRVRNCIVDIANMARDAQRAR